MVSTNAMSAKILGAFTILAGVLILDSHGFLAGTLVATAGSLPLFAATRHNTRGFNIRTVGMAAAYIVLIIFGLGLSA